MILKSRKNNYKRYDCLFSIAFGHIIVFTENIYFLYKLAKENTRARLVLKAIHGVEGWGARTHNEIKK